MDFLLGPEHAALRTRIEAFCDEHCSVTQEAARDREPRFPVELHRAMAEAGILGYCLPRDLGGSGGGPIELCIINEVFGRCSNTATNLLFINGICGALIGQAGSEDQRQQYVRGIAAGTLRFAFALTEPSAGSDAAAITSRAIRDGHDYIVDGTKLFTTGAADADFILTVVRTSPEGPMRAGTSLLIVPARSDGIAIERLDKIANNDVASCRVELRNVHVPVTNRLGKENQGWTILVSGGTLERLSVAATCVGTAQAAFDEVRAHLMTREQYGQAVTKFQAIQHQLADIATEIEAMRLLAYSAAWQVARDAPAVKQVSMAKLYCSEHANDIVMRCMRLLGGKAYLQDSAMPRRLRECLLTFYAGGTVEIQRNVIARSLGF